MHPVHVARVRTDRRRTPAVRPDRGDGRRPGSGTGAVRRRERAGARRSERRGRLSRAGIGAGADPEVRGRLGRRGGRRQVGLGRDPLWSPYAEKLAGHLNISRKHATVGVRANGHAWIRDHESTNHTYRNDVAVRKDVPAPLHDGDRIRLASTLTADVSIPGKAGDDDRT
ncbi:hypothetical protein GCM10029978_036820 [Actinoallomurus acanthiterrae]